jgi:hypothetical protein
MAYRSTQRYVRAKAQGSGKRNAQSQSARWRTEPASELQGQVLRRIERETGQTFADSMTKGEASDLISQRFAEYERAAHAHRRSKRARRRMSKHLGRAT